MTLLANIEIQPSPVGRYRNGKPRTFLGGGTTSASFRTSSSNRPCGPLSRHHPRRRDPPFETTQQAQGYGLKADYFAEVCHALRSASDLAQTIPAALPALRRQRDCTAIERLACGLAKLPSSDRKTLASRNSSSARRRKMRATARGNCTNSTRTGMWRTVIHAPWQHLAPQSGSQPAAH